MQKNKLSDFTGIASTNVNILRVFSAIAVIFCHSFYIAKGQPDFIYNFSKGQINLGGIAVGVFFFLSGFYVTKSLKNHKTISSFLCKRCKRIFPQLWIVTALSVFILGPFCTTISVWDYFKNSQTYLFLLNAFFVPIHNLPGVFLNNIFDATINGATWTLPIEFMAYICLAIVYWISLLVKNKRNIFQMLLILALIGGMILLFVFDNVMENTFLVQCLRPLLVFVVGCLYYEYASCITMDKMVAVACLVILILTCKFGGFSYAFILLAPYIVSVFFIASKQIKVKHVLMNISYEMYLVGWPIQQLVVMSFGGSMNVYLNVLITLPFDILLGYGIYKLVSVMERC